MSPLVDATIAASAFLACGLLLLVPVRRASAALRHRLLAMAVIAAAGTLALQLVLPPSWKLSLTPRPSHTEGTIGKDSSFQLSPDAPDAADGSRPPLSPRGTLVRLLFAAWLTGAVANLLVLAAGLARLVWLGIGADEASSDWMMTAVDISGEYELRRPVRLLQTNHPTLLVTWGSRRPAVILPGAAPHWSADRIRIVLRHELAHIRRRDWPVQMTAELLRSLQWFNPLAWAACRRLRQESEYACDDTVLCAGIDGSEYAAHLLDLARSVVNERGRWSAALAIARPSTLERRIRAMLNGKTNRTPLSRRGRFLTSMACVAAVLPVAAVTTTPKTAETRRGIVPPVKVVRLNLLAKGDPTSRIVRHSGAVEGTLLPTARAQTFASFSGAVFDPFGGLLPGVTLTLVNTQTGAKQEVHSDHGGKFEFVGLPSGDYTLTTMLPGFATLRDTLSFTAGDVTQRNLTLQIGSIIETVTVTDRDDYPAGYGTQTTTAGRPACSASVGGGVGENIRPLRIGGNIRAPQRIVDVRPVYPTASKDAKVQGVVILQGRIDTAGFVNDLQILRSPSPDLGGAAIEAVSGWRFQATELNCVPIDTRMTVTINFQLVQ